MPLYRANAVFAVGSRIPWGEREDDIDEHLDAVIETIRSRVDVGAVELDFDRTRHLLSVQLVCQIPKTDDDPEHAVRSALAEAIRASGGRHVELLPLGEESRLKPTQNQWSGLRTLHWQTRTFMVEPLPEEETGDE